MIVIPMVGKSSSFFNAVYMRPKYELEVEGVSFLYQAVNSFRKYFESEIFQIVVRNNFYSEEFVRMEIASLGIKNFIFSNFNKILAGKQTLYFMDCKKLMSI